MSTTNAIPPARTRAPKVRFVQESESEAGMECVSLEIEPREWDVNDAEARETAARDQLGDDYDWHREHLSAQWWIDPDRNAAGLAVYRLATA